MSPPVGRAKTIFLNAAEIADEVERRAYVDRECLGDESLRREVEDLLGHHAGLGSFLEPGSASESPTGTYAANSVAPPQLIGPYKLVERIGEGGMGEVWMAQQTEPVKRMVALKLIKPGMDSRAVLARFEAERQALALMDHPNIAKVLDANATPDGRPYFVMELVKGTPITRFCDERHLTPRQRLELFVPVCQAIQHAHQKGVIHRDIKPSNVLVALYDDKPVPKVIDFGVAKATGQQLTEKSLHTCFGAVVGTPEYMSPEQAGFNHLDVDTRSDVYSLGVLLYELLAGSPPFSRKDLERAGMLEMLRVIREQEPSKPSTKLSTAEGLPTLAANRGTEPAKLTKVVRGELDWIVMKALEKDRNRRYETANGFAMDVQRYLADEPVLACPPSVGYQLRKFARRNKAALIMASVIGVALLLAVGSFGWALRDRAAREANLAAKVDLILAEVEQLEKAQRWPEALAAAQRAEALTAGGADAATEKRVRQVLHDLQMVTGLEELRLRETRGPEAGATTDEGHPRLYAAAFREFGIDVETLPAEESAARLGARPAVAIALAAALDDWARTGRRKDPEKSKRLWALATALDPDPWRVSVRQAYAAMDVESLVKLADAPDTARQPPQSQVLLASSLGLCGQHEKALALLERACEIHPGDFSIHFNLGLSNSYVRPARREAAVRHWIAARALRPQSAATWNNLGFSLFYQWKLDQAIAAYRKAIEIDPKFPNAHNGLGTALLNQKKWSDAIAAYRKAIELDPKYAYPHYNLGIALREQKKLDEAIAAYRKAIEIDPKYENAYFKLGVALSDQKKWSDAIAAYRKGIEIDPKPVAYFNLGNALSQQEKLDEAIAAYRKAIELAPKFAGAYNGLGAALFKQKKWSDAVTAHRKAIELDPKDAKAYSNLGAALVRQGKLDEAIAAYRKAIEIDPQFATAYGNLGGALAQQGKLEDGIAACRKAIELDPKDSGARNNLARALSIVAWALATHTEPARRDPVRAMSLAKEAVEVAPNSVWAWQYRGWIHYSSGNWNSSIEALEKSCKLEARGTGDAGQWIVLALAHAKLAAQEGLPEKERERHKTEARRWYDQANEQIDSLWRVRPGDDVGQAVWDFRTEARELMAAKDTKR